MLHSPSVRSGLLGLSLCVLVTACGVTSVASPRPADRSERPVAATVDEGSGSRSAPDVANWPAVRAAADGQTVRWWLYGGDERVNRYIDEHVVPAAAGQGVTLERVPVADTADAVQRVVAEVQAGQADGSVDLIWINGENFAVGERGGLWLEDWAGRLPNARYVDPATADTDFGLAVDGQESPWSRALFVYAHDTARMPQPRGRSGTCWRTRAPTLGGSRTPHHPTSPVRRSSARWCRRSARMRASRTSGGSNRTCGGRAPCIPRARPS